MCDESGWSRRSILSLLAFGGSWAALSQSEAAELVSDDFSFIRTLDLSAEKILESFPQGQRVGAENPDVTLVELFDYNCGFCRRAWRPLADLMESDSRLALYFVHFPILSPGSEVAAAIQHAVFLRDGALLANQLHQALMTLSGRIDADRVHRVCETLGIKIPSERQIGDARGLMLENRRHAGPLGIRYTPTFALANTTFIGWPGPKTMSDMIGQVRQCGRVQCS